MDEVILNANQIENSAESSAVALRKTALPFSVDPVLWRFQVPKWWRNDRGETKSNYRRLGAEYVKGTSIKIAAGPLLDTVPGDDEWRILAANVISYQKSRLLAVPAQLDMLDPELPRELRPARLVAPGLVAYSAAEDRINRLLIEECSAAASDAVGAQVIVPLDRLIDDVELDRLLASVPAAGVSSYFLWTPEVTEEHLITHHATFAALLRLIATLADRGIPVGHQYGSYTIAALHDLGLAALIHHLGWVDKGEPAEEQRFMLRSCQSYVPGVRRCSRFHEADDLGRSLTSSEYGERYCACTFCLGVFDTGHHPLDLLLEDQIVVLSDGRKRRTPTGRAVTANTWHYLLSRRLEVQAFSERPAVEVLAHDIERAAALAGAPETNHLRRLAAELRTA
jgi:hypothetical protein